jgi:hypothetical protein
MNSNSAYKLSSLLSSSQHSSSNISNHTHHSNHNFFIKFTERSRSALIALIVLIIEDFHSTRRNANKLNNKEKQNHVNNHINQDLINYLLLILESLPNFKWVDDSTSEFGANHNVSLKTSKNKKYFNYHS